MQYETIKPHPLADTFTSLLQSTNLLIQAADSLIKGSTIVAMSRTRTNPQAGALAKYGRTLDDVQYDQAA
jgi:hypothetical protein